MKKVIPGLVILGLLCLLLITTCGFEIPESITIKGSPGLYVPLGSPFANMPDENNLANLISPDSIRNKLSETVFQSGSDGNLTIYEANKELLEALKVKYPDINPDAQTYLARYHLADMPLDLKKYADDVMVKINADEQFNIPAAPEKPVGIDYVYLIEDEPHYVIPVNNDPSNAPNIPFVRIPLDEMAKLVKWVEREDDGIFGLELTLDTTITSALADILELKIRGFGLPGWTKGILTDDNGTPTTTNPTKIRYYDETKRKFYPRDQYAGDGVTVTDYSDLDNGKELLIYARITNTFPELKLQPKMVFDWEKVLIDTTTDTGDQISSFKKDYPINSSFSEKLGDGVSFKKVAGYMYMSIPGIDTHLSDNSIISVGIYNSNGQALSFEEHPLDNVDPPVFPSGDTFGLPNKDLLLEQSKMSLADGQTLQLEKILQVSNATLQVAVKIDDIEVTKEQVQQNAVVQFDLLVLIPLDLKFTNQVPASQQNDVLKNYVMLDLEAIKNALNSNSEKGDLFGRKEGDENNYLKDIEYVEITLKYSPDDINIIDPEKLAVLVDSQLLEFKKDNASLRLDGPSLNKIPFNPDFTVLLLKDEGQDYGSFVIKRQAEPSFDFKLYITAKANLEYKLDFNKDKS